MACRIALVLAFFMLIPNSTVSAELVNSWEDALTLAAEKELPIVVDFWADWCSPCKRFDKDSDENAQLKAALDGVVLFKTDAERAGKELAEQYLVGGYPTYMITNAKGETLARWWGYQDADWWLGKFEETMQDPTTMEEKKHRHAADPNPTDAVTLAEFHESREEYDLAVEFYEDAKRLEPEQARKYDDALFSCLYSALRDEKASFADLAARADVIVARGEDATDEDLYYIARYMVAAARRSGKLEASAAYLVPAVERLSAVAEQDESAKESLARLAIDHALIVEKDQEKALLLKKASYDEGWMSDPNAMNSFAWWCFENELHLEEAEGIARDAVELATTVAEKVQILDTAAEICNLRGECRDAVSLMQKALDLDPTNARTKEQLERFQKILDATG